MRKFLSEHQRTINVLALVALATIVIITGLRFIPAAFEHANVIADTLFELSIAYIGAWFFNLLVIELPRRRQRSEAFSAISFRLEAFADRADGFRHYLSLGKDLDAKTTGDRDLVLAYLQGQWNTQDAAKKMIQKDFEEGFRDYSPVSGLVLMFFDVELHIAAMSVIDSSFYVIAQIADWSTETGLSTLVALLDSFDFECKRLRTRLQTARESL